MLMEPLVSNAAEPLGTGANAFRNAGRLSHWGYNQGGVMGGESVPG